MKTPLIFAAAAAAALGMTAADRWDDLLFEHVSIVLEHFQAVLGLLVGALGMWLRSRKSVPKALLDARLEELERVRGELREMQKLRDAFARGLYHASKQHGLPVEELLAASGQVPIVGADRQFIDGVTREVVDSVQDTGSVTGLDATFVRKVIAEELERGGGPRWWKRKR